MGALIASAANCSDSLTNFPPAEDGGAAGMEPVAGAGGIGGEGGTHDGCQGCGGATPICEDDTCVSSCPAGREACHPGADPDAPSICCPAEEQCCAAADHGYADGDLCMPADAPCPFPCPDGRTLCDDGAYCALDAATMSYACVDSCDVLNLCGATTCCPLGSRCGAGGECDLPDLTIDAPRVAASARMELKSFAANACEIAEGCVAAPGDRVLLRFDLESPNVGEGDLVLGDPFEQANLFEYSPCHNHFHFNSYADYSLEDAQGTTVATGHKQAFCLLDWHAYEPGAPPDALYDCEYQGIQAGWSDVYGSGLDCQWVDVTGVPPGDYKLRVRVNYDQILGESDYTNNEALVDVTIPPDSCPNGCRGYDPSFCTDADPMGYANDGSCDCLGVHSWDAADCATCLSCPAQTDCPGGCTPNSGPSCTATNPDGLDHNGVCDCGGAFAWDDDDCDHCISTDPDCPAIDSCPDGCATGNNSPPECCSEADDPCGFANDGWCDCDGAWASGWDYVDCSSCACN